ncbi:MAG TPA: TetR/AcrR family transcriptional regulator [Acidimicrobiia bacterium]|nr:TetR/AcrR family transcriptional regulator [Acidimicrobiia bacterium]
MTTAADARDTRDRILDATNRLLRRQGYTATGIKQIVAEGDAPLGSIYHYFPGGKEQIAVEALARVGERIRMAIASLANVADVPATINAFFVHNAERLRDSDYERGCPIATVALETSSDIERIRQVCEDVFKGWQAALTHVFTEAGIPEDDAAALATFVLSSYEGALTMSRALRDIQPMLTSGAAVASVLHAHLGEVVRAG